MVIKQPLQCLEMFLTELQVCLVDNEKRRHPYDMMIHTYIFFCRARTHAHYLLIIQIDRILPGPTLNVYRSFSTILQLVIKYTVIVIFTFKSCSSLCLSVFWFKCRLMYKDSNRVGNVSSAMELYTVQNVADFTKKCVQCAAFMHI